jgi:hypothetical protein
MNDSLGHERDQPHETQFATATLAFDQAILVRPFSMTEFRQSVSEAGGYGYTLRDRKHQVARTADPATVQLLSDFQTVEEFFLAKQMFGALTEFVSISRFALPKVAVQVTTNDAPHRQRTLFDGETQPIVSLYRYEQDEGDVVATVALIFDVSYMGQDDLIYFKNLKWYSRDAFPSNANFKAPGVPKATGTLDSLILETWNIVGGGTHWEIASDVLMDAIELRLRDKRTTSESDIFSIVAGDEGVAADWAGTDAPRQPLPSFSSRPYFIEYVAGTSVLSLLSPDGISERLDRARSYRDRFGDVLPLTEYLERPSSTVPALGAGLYVYAEIASAVYLLYLDFDRRIRKVLIDAAILNVRPAAQAKSGRLRGLLHLVCTGLKWLAARVASQPASDSTGKDSDGADTASDRVLRDMLGLQQRAASTLAHVQLLTQGDLWLGTKDFAVGMFGGRVFQENFERRLELLFSLVRSEYDRRTNISLDSSNDRLARFTRIATVAGVVGTFAAIAGAVAAIIAITK